MKKQTEQPKQESKMIQKFRSGQITATIFEKEITVKRDDKDIKVKVHNVKICKSYKVGEEWKETNNYEKQELQQVQLVTTKAQEFLYLNEE